MSMNNSTTHAMEEENFHEKKQSTEIAKCAKDVEQSDAESIPQTLFDSSDDRIFEPNDKNRDVSTENSGRCVLKEAENIFDSSDIRAAGENHCKQTACKSTSVIESPLEIIESEEDGQTNQSNSKEDSVDLDCNSNYSNNNNAKLHKDLTPVIKEVPSNELDTAETSVEADEIKLLFTITHSNIFQKPVQPRKQVLPFKYRTIMGNSTSHHLEKRHVKKEKNKAAKRRSPKKAISSKDEQSCPAESRKRRISENASVGSRLSGNYDNISVLSPEDVMPSLSKDDTNGKVKSSRLNESSSSSSLRRSRPNVSSYTPSLKSEFDFRKSKKSLLNEPCESGASKHDGDEKNVSGIESLETASTDSTLMTLRGVCSVITNIQDGINDSDEIDNSKDSLTKTKYSGKKHPTVYSSYPILSTRAPMSPADPYHSPNPESPAEPVTHLETEKLQSHYDINKDTLFDTKASNHATTDISSTPTTVTAERQHCKEATQENSTPMSTVQGIISAKEGFEGSLLQSWLLLSCKDDTARHFVTKFCDSLVRSRILIPRMNMDEKTADKENIAADGKATIFNRLKFMPSQIYTWGPFSRINSSNSTNKVATYKDFARRQVEINPTLSPLSGFSAPGCSSKAAGDLEKNESPDETDVTSKETSDKSSNNVDTEKLLTDEVFNTASPSSSEMSTATLQNGTNAGKKLGNVWPPPRPEENNDERKLKYSEAEHQHELAELKRNHTEELYKITKDYETNIYEMNEEHTQEVEVMQQEANLLRQEITYLKGILNTQKQDATTQTYNVAQLRLTKGIQVDLGGDSRPPPPQITLPKTEDEARNEGETAAPPPPPPPPPPVAPVPPPPPPSAPGIPPPPPPPAPGVPIMSKKDSPKRPPVEPRKPMKPLYWKRIQIPKKEFSSNNSVWVHISDVSINEEEMELTFCKATVVKKAKALSETITEKKKIAPAKVLDNKRSQAVGIFISSLHVELEDLKSAVLNMDTSIVDEESMKAIYSLRATKEEFKAIQAHLDSQKKTKEEKQPLDKPEKFIHSLAEIDHFEDRMVCINFRTTFHEDIVSIQDELQNMSNALQELQNKDTVLRVLGLVLSIGNYLNGGNRTRGQADGFQLDILSKLKDVKGQKDNKSFSLLNYVALVYLRSFDQDVKYENRPCPVPTFQCITLASQVNFTEISKYLKRVAKDLKDCDKRVANVLKKSKAEYVEPFKGIMETFIQNAYASLEKNQIDLEETQAQFQNAIDFFCLKAKSKPIEPKDFFGYWQPFCIDFHAIWKVELKRYIKEELDNAKKKVEEIRERQRASTTTTTTTTRRRRPNSLKSRLLNTKK